VQEELVALATAAGAALDPDDNTQIKTAVLAMIAAVTPQTGSYVSNPPAPNGATLWDAANENMYLRIAGAWVRTSQAPGLMCFDYVATPPAGYLKVNPILVHSQAVYPELAARLGVTSGGTWSFVDARGEFIRVWDDGRGIDAGRVIRSAQLDAMQGHRHHANNFDLSGTNPNIGGGGAHYEVALAGTGAPLSDGSNGAPRVASETRGRNIAFPLLIKV
jgi:hypothetical protein